MDRGQQEISKAVAAGREAFGEQKEPEIPSRYCESCPCLESIEEGVMLHQDYFFVVLLVFGLYLMLQFYWTGGHFRRH